MSVLFVQIKWNQSSCLKNVHVCTTEDHNLEYWVSIWAKANSVFCLQIFWHLMSVDMFIIKTTQLFLENIWMDDAGSNKVQQNLKCKGTLFLRAIYLACSGNFRLQQKMPNWVKIGQIVPYFIIRDYKCHTRWCSLLNVWGKQNF